MDILTETKTLINKDFNNLYKNKIIMILVNKNTKITKEYLDYCYNNKIFINSAKLVRSYKDVDILDYFNNHLDDIFIMYLIEPIITTDYIVYILRGGFYRMKSNIINKFIKINYKFNEYKKFIFIDFYVNYDKPMILHFTNAIMNLIYDKIPFVYINIYCDEGRINFYISKLELILKKYNNFIYISSALCKKEHVKDKCYKNFTMDIYKGKYIKKTIYNRLLYYFLMYTVFTYFVLLL